MGIPNWKNRTLWTGDNLDIMRGMNSESVDLIYLDPPFNSNKNYAAPIGSQAAGAAFKDTWTLDDVDEAWHGEIADNDPTLYAIIDAAGQAHGKSMKSYLIMMAVRLLEMKRILKETGSIYLHCDPVASHYLKMLMDAIFTVSGFRNEIVWRRYGSHNDARRYGRVHDVLLFYVKAKGTWNGAWTELDPQYVEQSYRQTDERGRFTTGPLHTGGLSGGGYAYDFHGHVRTWKFPEKRMRELEEEGRIAWARGKASLPRRKIYLSESKGKPVSDVWDDIRALTGSHKERVEYPTQKPLALLERIIQASSAQEQIVLDPFCGCATACVAAEKHGRQWVGIDLSSKAADLVKLRLQKDMGLFYDVQHRTDIPKRTDQGTVPSYKTHKHTLFGKQEGVCNGCRQFFQFRNFTIDHVVPQAKGGTDHVDNLQLLCGACNSMKGAGTQEALLAKLKREGIRSR